LTTAGFFAPKESTQERLPSHPGHCRTGRTRTRGGCALGEVNEDVGGIALFPSDLPIAGIALDCGFCHQGHLTRAFRKFCGTTPAAYRSPVRS